MALVLTRSVGQAIRFKLPGGYAYMTLTKIERDRVECRVQVGNKVETVGFHITRQRQLFPDVAIVYSKNERGGSARFAIEAPRSIGIVRVELIDKDEQELEELKAKWLD